METKTLENWIIHPVATKQQSSRRAALIVGEIDGKRILLQPIISFVPDEEAFICSDKNKYKIGKPDKKYEERYPNARVTFVEALKRNYKASVCHQETKLDQMVG